MDSGKDLNNEECIISSLRQVQKRKDDHVLQKPKVVAVLTDSCYDEDGTNLSRLHETWDIPKSKIYEPHITLAALYWNKEVASLMG